MSTKLNFPEICGNSYHYEITVLGYIAIFYNGAWIMTVETYEDALNFIK